MIFLLFSPLLLRFHSRQMTLPFGCPPQVLSVRLPQSKLPSNRLVEWSSTWRLSLNPLKCESSFFSLDPYQSRLKPSLSIFNIPLNFNPYPTFLGVTFDRTLSFKHHVLSLRKKFHSRFRAFRSIASASWPQRNLYVPYIKPFFAPS